MTDQDYDYVQETARAKNINLLLCPTCRRPYRELAPGVKDWSYGTYRLDGQEHPCNCKIQARIRCHYLLAGIPKNFWHLGPEDFWGDRQALSTVLAYLDNWKTEKQMGLGACLFSPVLGVGKTMLATIIAKQLIRQGERVCFTSFRDAVSLYDLPASAKEDKIKRLRETTVLVLDEISVSHISVAQKNFYATEFEDLIRFRTSGDCVTIIATNLTPEQLEDEYPRCFSLLAAKQHYIEVKGEDARADGTKKLRDLTMAAGKEVRPL